MAGPSSPWGTARRRRDPRPSGRGGGALGPRGRGSSSARFIDQPTAEAADGRARRRAGSGRLGLAEVEEILSEQLATRVSIQMGRKRGSVVIEFGSADDLERIVSEIIGSGPGLAPD